MSDRGKIDSRVFAEVIAPNLGADRDDVRIGPQHGVDFGVLSVGERALVTATDPISILPELGLERAGRIALDIVLTDVAVSGVAPSHVTVSLSVPPDLSADDLARVWRGLTDHADRLGVSVVAEHVGRDRGSALPWLGGATAVGIGSHEDVIRPDGARPGDAVVVSTGPAAEIAGLFATLYPAALDLPPEAVATAQDRIEDIPAVADAVSVARAAELTALHDATEGGFVGAMTEMATGAGVRFEVERDEAPMGPGVGAVCDVTDLDPWTVTSAGSLLLTAPPEEAAAAVATLERRGTPAAVVGSVHQTSHDDAGVVLDGERVEPPESDPAWAAMARLREES